MDLNHGDLTISAPAFAFGEAIPAAYSNDQGDTSPELQWTGVPEGTAELVLVVHDPDAPLVDGFTHWVATGIDPATDGLAEGATGGFKPHRNTSGDTGYMGPAPPPGHGPHHYFFHLFAVDSVVDSTVGADGPVTRRDVLAAIEGHVIEQARTVGTFRIDEGAPF